MTPYGNLIGMLDLPSTGGGLFRGASTPRGEKAFA